MYEKAMNNAGMEHSNRNKDKVAALVSEIKERVSLTKKPIGVSLFKSLEEIPEKARRPSSRGMAWPFCLAENIVRVLGWTIALTMEDHFCIFGAAGLGHIQLPDYLRNGAIGCQHTRDPQLGKKLQNKVQAAFFPPESTLGVLLTPATAPLFYPDAVFIYGNPSQVGKIAKGVAWTRGEPVAGTAGGFGCCLVAASSAIIEKKPAVIVPSAGEKVLGHCEENEVLIALPVEDLADVVDGMKATDFLLPYPSGKYMMFEPQKVPKGYPLDLISHKTYEAARTEKTAG